jgi:hypothetical protein
LIKPLHTQRALHGGVLNQVQLALQSNFVLDSPALGNFFWMGIGHLGDKRSRAARLQALVAGKWS